MKLSKMVPLLPADGAIGAQQLRGGQPNRDPHGQAFVRGVEKAKRSEPQARKSHYSLNRCDACVIDAPARIAAATIADSVSIASVAPA
jgi:hypothetical protein